MSGRRVCWSGEDVQSARESEHPKLSVSKDLSGFLYVLAQPVGADRTVALTLESSPEAGVYEFVPVHDEFEFSVRLEYQDEPYPNPVMHVSDVKTPLAAVEAGDRIEIGLRMDQTDSPGIKSIKGQVSHIMDFSGLIPDTSDFFSYSLNPAPVLSLLVSLSDEAHQSGIASVSKMNGQTRLQPIGDSFGTLDVVGGERPLNLEWEGKSHTPALQVEFARIDPGQKSELTVENNSLPDVEFDDIAAHSLNSRISILESALSKALDRQVSDETIEFFATSVDEPSRDRTITVQYDSSRSKDTLTKSGTFVGTYSMYFAEDNQARHQLRFSGSDGRFYILLDPNPDATTPAKVCSTSLARHWDTDLGPLRDFELSE